ncbi:hypothetical protein KY389_11495 [Paracoccus bogoriensis]|uniref:hypothetical protein n=1 Tax=Paracoccus bogoriensis TaxID=242065 RepID=UPI001CA57F20|nr:hypothetical protein [Paracoccus bogoriensis]MBW7057309.1 hypothetical protein [Paracoccus bogoriensis]
MTHWRSEYRAAVRAALQARPRFADVDVLPIWPGTVDDETLPVIGVVTPNEPVARDSEASTTRRTLLQVALRRIGGVDVEDQLDLDSDEIEATVLGALRSPTLRVQLEDLSIVSDSRAHSYVGTLVMSFRLHSWQPEVTHP